MYNSRISKSVHISARNMNFKMSKLKNDIKTAGFKIEDKK